MANTETSVKPKKKSQRWDKIRNRAKIIKEVIKKPLASQREIANKSKLWKTTVQEHLKDLPNTTKSDHIEKMLEKDLNIVNLAQEELERRLSDPEKLEKIGTRDIIASADVSAKRYSLFKGTATDDEGWLKEQIISYSIPDNWRW